MIPIWDFIHQVELNVTAAPRETSSHRTQSSGMNATITVAKTRTRAISFVTFRRVEIAVKVVEVSIF